MTRPSDPAAAPADLVLRGGTVLTLDGTAGMPTAVAVRGERIAAVGSDHEIGAWIGARTSIIELHGGTVMPGLIDGHAHLDREALKELLPSVSGCRSIAELIERLRGLAATTPAGRWITTMPLGEPPEYAWSESMFDEKRLPDRHDLDRASRDHPILIRSAWGYWPGQPPLVAIANSAALALAGVRKGTPSPSPRLRIDTDAGGEPTGRFFEDTLQPLAEFTLFRCAPQFTADDRARTLEQSMRRYNAFGTTGIFEGHGVADEVIDAYRRTRAADRQTVRANLVFSPGWSGASEQDIVQWVTEHAAGLRAKANGDDWLRLAGIYAEPDTEPQDTRLRARCAPQTGWAGFRYDAKLEPALLKTLLRAAAREKLRVCGIQTGMADAFIEIGRELPIDGLRWVIAHPQTLDATQIAGLRDHGIVVSTLTGGHVWRRGSALRARIGIEREHTICPIRSLLDAGVPVSLATDNVPISMWPCIWQAVERIDRDTGSVIAPDQRVSREQALRCATVHGAWLCHDEDQRGTLTPGKLADLTVLDDNPLTVETARLASLAPRLTLVGGRTVWSQAAA